jgi:site-specific DNA-methyltransferase (adenine-specific)
MTLSAQHPEIQAVLDGESDGCIVCADCLDVLPLLPDGCVPVIWTDPPYGHGNMDGDLQAARVRDSVAGGRKAIAEPIQNDVQENMWPMLKIAISQFGRVLVPDCCCCCCCCSGGGGPTVTFAKLACQMDVRPLRFFHAVVWDKSHRGNGMGWRFRRNYEFVMVAHHQNGKLRWANLDKAIPNVFRCAPPRIRQHPNEKPLELVEYFLEAASLPADIILDPFCGSGTTCVAAKKLGRRWIGIEISEEYCETARRRVASTPKPLFAEPEAKAEQAELFGKGGEI